ncbi:MULTISPECIES: UDP-4-amino-4,6-dideoxy-N-acetyl-beta-L-altrosamine N-acetyltransferase [Acinetobacter]|uniref:UDP-4-amino-4, 6-dideoxy-N-acetyl-beta-L-altrosamine N-acetyltransferase n=1 Tax=Acinetobacter TaxID=469 RepID=UPI00195BE43B|nr:UDP-4-amino-4,6-dideoxy-N-acetyl-beta-L-altrosamine N-acetyltransferase [Acinetobacter sp. 105-3]MBM7139700.1 UDP-4-amino-4,6-dideoxy-N-acetyl-beta-L-altrosamine N-acetyltransferase [Acinetobacter sp. 105-3]
MLDKKNPQLRALNANDLEMVLQWRNHDEIRKWMINSDVIALSDHLAWFERNKERTDRLFFIFEYQQQSQGYVSFIAVPNSSVYEWGFYIKPQAEKGMGHLLGSTALDFAFEQLKIEKVFGQVLDFNEKSLSFHKKMGFLQEGLLRKHFKDERGEFDIHQFGLLRKEWLEEK